MPSETASIPWASTGAVARTLDDDVGRSTFAPSIALPVRRRGTPHRRNRVPNRVPDSAFLMPLRDTHSNEKSCKRTGRSSGMALVKWASRVRGPLPALRSSRGDTSARAPHALFLSEPTYPSARSVSGVRASLLTLKTRGRVRGRKGAGATSSGLPPGLVGSKSAGAHPLVVTREPPSRLGGVSHCQARRWLGGSGCRQQPVASSVRSRVLVGPRAALAQRARPSRY